MMTLDCDPAVDYTRRHLRFGWWSLLGFLCLGFMLELLHGFKAGFYLDVSNETRRLMWTLAHAHGALLGLASAPHLERQPRSPLARFQIHMP